MEKTGDLIKTKDSEEERSGKKLLFLISSLASLRTKGFYKRRL